MEQTRWAEDNEHQVTEEFLEVQEAATRAIIALDRIDTRDICNGGCDEHMDRSEVHGAIFRQQASALQFGLMHYYDEETGSGCAVKICELMHDAADRPYRVERTITFPEWGEILYSAVPYDVSDGVEAEPELVEGVHDISENPAARDTFLSVASILDQDMFNLKRTENA